LIKVIQDYSKGYPLGAQHYLEG